MFTDKTLENHSNFVKEYSKNLQESYEKEEELEKNRCSYELYFKNKEFKYLYDAFKNDKTSKILPAHPDYVAGFGGMTGYVGYHQGTLAWFKEIEDRAIAYKKYSTNNLGAFNA